MEAILPEWGPFVLRARILTPLAAGGTRYEADGRLAVDARGVITEAGPWAKRSAVDPRGVSTNADPVAGVSPGDARGVITDGSPEAGGVADRGADEPRDVVDLRPLILMPGMVDLHVHLPQLPNAGGGAGLDVLTWLQRYTFAIERAFDV